MKVLITLIFIGAIVVLGVMVGRGNPAKNSAVMPQRPTITYQESSPSALISPTSTQSPTVQGGGGPTGHLYLVSRTSGTTEIIAVEVITKDKKTLFSDKNSDQKVKLVSSLPASGDSVILLLGNDIDPAGQLVAIATDGSGKKTVLTDQFLSTDPPVVSPDRTKLGLVSFSNAEPNFGFTLVLTDVNGKNKQELAKDQSGIAHLAFSPDGKQIAFVKGAAASSSEIDVVTIASAKTEILYTAKDKIIEDFDWSLVGPLVVTMTTPDKKAAKQSEVYVVDPKTKSTIQVTKNGKSERSPKIAPDAQGLAFIQSNDPTKAGDVIITLPNGDQPVTLTTANQIIGWSK